MREISKTRKLQVATAIIASILIFYAAGIVSNLFANPAFSMFFIISEETAHNIAYAAVAVAADVAVIGLAVTLIKKRKTTFPETNNKPAISRNETADETQVTAAPSTDFQGITNKSEKNKKQQKNQDKIICPACKKEFTQPIYLIDNSSSMPKLVKQCPYCDQNLFLTPKNTEEEYFSEKYVNEPHKESPKKP